MNDVTVFVLCSLSNHDLHLYQVEQKYLERVQSFGADTISLLIITKGHNSVKIVSGVTIFFICTSSNQDLHLYQVSLKYLELFQSYGEARISVLIITMGRKSLKIVSRITVLVLCTLSNHGLHLYQISLKCGFRVMEGIQFQQLLLQRGIIP